MATPTQKKRGFPMLGAFPDMRDWGSGPGLGGWGAEGAPGASAQRPDYSKDRELLETISRRLREVRELDLYDVEARADDGEITLTGTVPAAAMRLLLEQTVAAIDGVRRVVNELLVRPHDPEVMGSE